jgi:lysophospholipase L1-like esterase
MRSKRRAWLAIGLLALGAACARAPASLPDVDRWEGEIQRFEELDRAAPPPKGGVVFIGSSSIRRWASLGEDFPGLAAINRGFGGSELADSTRYVERIVAPYAPRLVVLYAGDNDLARGRSPQQLLQDYQGFVARVREKVPGAGIAYISIKPSLARVALLESVRKANQLILDYSKGEQGLTYIDVFTPMLGANSAPRAELFVSDGLHLNSEGYALWREIVAPYLQSGVGQRAP